MSVVSQSIEDREERTDGGYDSQQNGARTQRLTTGDIEARSGRSGNSGVERLLHRGGPQASWGGPGRRRGPSALAVLIV